MQDWCCPVCCRGFWGTSLLMIFPDYVVGLAKLSLKSSSQKVCELESLVWLWSLLWLSPVWGRCSGGPSLLQLCLTQAALWTGSLGMWGSAGTVTIPFQPLSHYPRSFVPPTTCFSSLPFSFPLSCGLSKLFSTVHDVQSLL